MSTRTIETCPVQERGIALLHHSFEQVAKTFSDFRSAGERGPFEQRGGFRRDGKTPRIFSHSDGSQDQFSRYHIASSFTPEQLAYVGICVAGLNKLSRGETFSRKTSELPTLSEEIQSRFLTPSSAYLSFGRAVAESTISLFYPFQSFISKLNPCS